MKIIFCMIVAIFCMRAARADEASICRPVQLRTEYLVNPLGLDVAKPRLTWILTAPNNAPRGLAQSAYRILVASTPELLVQGKGDLWDSGVVKSAETANVPYAGATLGSRQACYWKVQVTDSLGRTSAWSEPASWEMGLLQPGDWQAKWIEAMPLAADIQPGPHTLTIRSARYESATSSESKDVTGLIRGMVKDNRLIVTVDNKTFGGDPAVGHPKRLTVAYTLDGHDGTISQDESTELQLPGGSPSLPYLRTEFTLAKPVARARLYATALGLYDMRLNGQRVGDHLLAPDWTDYSVRSRYQDYDVTSMVKQGANAWGAQVGNGWYSGHIGNGAFQVLGKVPALLAQLEVIYADGSTERFVTDASWKRHAGPILSADFMLGENYDAQREIVGWDQPGLDLNTWIPASVRIEPVRPLDGQVDEPVRQTAELHAKSMKEVSPGRWVYDFGQNMVGVLRLNVTAPAGTRVVLRHAEMVNEDGTLYTANLRSAPSVDTYICKGGGRETWQPRFTFHGFRYAQISGLPSAPAQDDVTGIVIGSVVPDGFFSSSSESVNQLQSNIQWGMRGNYLSVPTDCPQRDERMGWMGDAQVFIRTAAYNGDIAAFFTKWLVDVTDSQTDKGGFTDVAPIPKPAEKTYGPPSVPAWGDAGVICPWTIYLMYGDRRILEQHLPSMTKWVEWCRSLSTDLIRDHGRGHDYGDWLSQNENTNKELIGTAYFAYSTLLVSKSYAAVGDKANAEKYGDLFEQIKTAFLKRYSDSPGHLKDNTQAAYAMALRFDLLP